MIQLLAREVKFRSDLDEKMFFNWLDQIESVVSKSGEESSIVIGVKSKNISDDDLRELVGLFERYHVDMRELAQFANEKNQKWFKQNKVAYWHKKVFG